MNSQIQAAKSAVCHVFGLKPEAMTQRRRPARIAWPRQIAMAISYELTDAGLTDVGIEFGRHHGTVIHALNQVKSQLDVSEDARRQWSQCVLRFMALNMSQTEPLHVATTG